MAASRDVVVFVQGSVDPVQLGNFSVGLSAPQFLVNSETVPKHRALQSVFHSLAMQ